MITPRGACCILAWSSSLVNGETEALRAHVSHSRPRWPHREPALCPSSAALAPVQAPCGSRAERSPLIALRWGEGLLLLCRVLGILFWWSDGYVYGGFSHQTQNVLRVPQGTKGLDQDASRRFQTQVSLSQDGADAETRYGRNEGQVPSGLGSGAQSAASDSANLGRKEWGAAPSLGRTWLDREQGM